MEFISVMGILVPMEVTKGVSSDDDAEENIVDPIQDTNTHSQQKEDNDSDHTEPKCNISEQKSSTSNITSTAKKKSSKGNSKSRSEEKLKRKKQTTKQRQKENQAQEKLEQEYEITTRTKKSERKSTKTKADRNPPPLEKQVHKQSDATRTRAAKKKSIETESKAGERTLKGQNMDQTTEAMNTRTRRAKTEAQPSILSKGSPPAATVKLSRATRKGKQPLKRSRHTHEEADKRSNSTKQARTREATTPDRITETWKLENDDEDLENEDKLQGSKSKKLQMTAASARAPSTTKKLQKSALPATMAIALILGVLKLLGINRGVLSTMAAHDAPYQTASSLLTQGASVLHMVGEFDALKRDVGVGLGLGHRENATHMVAVSGVITHIVLPGLSPMASALPMEEVQFALELGATSWLLPTENALRMVDG